jgi:hypothetical protein
MKSAFLFAVSCFVASAQGRYEVEQAAPFVVLRDNAAGVEAAVAPQEVESSVAFESAGRGSGLNCSIMRATTLGTRDLPGKPRSSGLQSVPSIL